MKLIICSIILFLLAIGAGSCKKEKEEVFTITGRLLTSCDNHTPAKNIAIKLYAPGKTICLFSGKFTSITTFSDNNGNFSISYTKTKCDDELFLNIESDTIFPFLVQSVHTNRNINLGDLFIKNNTHYIIKIKTDTSYSSNDLLIYDIDAPSRNNYYSKTRKFIYGPFTNNQVIDTSVSTTGRIFIDAPNKNKEDYFGSAQINNKSAGIVKQLYMYYDSTIHCKKYSEVVIEIKK